MPKLVSSSSMFSLDLAWKGYGAFSFNKNVFSPFLLSLYPLFPPPLHVVSLCLPAEVRMVQVFSNVISPLLIFRQALQLYKADPAPVILEIINTIEGGPPVDVSAVRSM